MHKPPLIIWTFLPIGIQVLILLYRPDDHYVTRTGLEMATGNWKTVHPNNVSHSV